MAKGACFLIISLLVSSNAVAKETEAFEKLFSFEAGRPGEDPCAAYVVSGDGPLLSGDSPVGLQFLHFVSRGSFWPFHRRWKAVTDIFSLRRPLCILQTCVLFILSKALFPALEVLSLWEEE